MARTDEASRREMAAVKLSIGEGDFTPEGIRRSLLAASLEAELEEDFSQRLIRVTDARDHRAATRPWTKSRPRCAGCSPPISRWSLTSAC